MASRHTKSFYRESFLGCAFARGEYIVLAQLPSAQLPLWEILRQRIVAASILLLLQTGVSYAQTACGASGSNTIWTNCNQSAEDLRAANLLGAHLTNDNLSGAVLLGVSLAGAQLKTIDLRNSVMAKANLKNARLTDVKLAGADLRMADLSGATLINVDFTGADMRWANLKGAVLWTGVKLDNANLAYATWTDGAYCSNPAVGRCK